MNIDLKLSERKVSSGEEKDDYEETYQSLEDHEPDPDSTFVCSVLIVWMFVIILIVNASYSICAPFLPWLAEDHGVSQSYIGFMFCVYSIAMAIASPIVGKYQYQVGRRTMTQIGLIIVGLTFLGFYLVNLVQNTTTFIVCFILVRIVQGIGTCMCQTSIYAILTLCYPNHVHSVVGTIEVAVGIGLSIGPVIGAVLYEVGGFITPFSTFCVSCIVLGALIKFIIPESADRVDEKHVDTSQISYCSLLKNRRVLFANLCVLVSMLQYTFIDPIFSNYLKKSFGISYASSGYFFLSLGAGYTVSCFCAPITVTFMNNRHTCMVAAIIMGIFTMFYAPSYVLQLPLDIHFVVIGMFMGGVANGHLIVPSMDEMIEASQQHVGATQSSEALNDICAGLFNMSFSTGEILGPLIGNYLYSKSNFTWACDIFGVLSIAFGVTYFIVSLLSKSFK